MSVVVGGDGARIVEALVSVLYERGFGGVSVGSVCARAGVSRGAFYEVFDGLEDCFLAVLDRGVVIPGVLRDPRAHRARRCLLFLAEQGARGLASSNRDVAEGIGVARQEQVSRLLARLAGLGLVVKDPASRGRANAWSLTPEGLRVARALRAAERGGGVGDGSS
jgi:AcrR family transcriptional regulator